MLAEFAATAVVSSEAIAKFWGGDMDMDIDGLENEGKEADVIPLSKVNDLSISWNLTAGHQTVMNLFISFILYNAYQLRKTELHEYHIY